MEEEVAFVSRIILRHPERSVLDVVCAVRCKNPEFPEHLVEYEFTVLLPAAFMAADLPTIRREAMARLQRDLGVITTTVARAAGTGSA
jgi:hypothetical protein